MPYIRLDYLQDEKMKNVNKKGDLKSFAIGLIIFATALTALVAFSSNMFDFYGVDVGDEYQPVYDSIQLIGIDEQSNITSGMQENVESTRINPGFTNTLSLITDVIVTAIKLPFTTMYGIFTVISVIASKVGIPPFVTKAVLTVITITLTITVLSWIFGRRIK